MAALAAQAGDWAASAVVEAGEVLAAGAASSRRDHPSVAPWAARLALAQPGPAPVVQVVPGATLAIVAQVAGRVMPECPPPLATPECQTLLGLGRTRPRLARLALPEERHLPGARVRAEAVALAAPEPVAGAQWAAYVTEALLRRRFSIFTPCLQRFRWVKVACSGGM